MLGLPSCLLVRVVQDQAGLELTAALFRISANGSPRQAIRNLARIPTSPYVGVQTPEYPSFQVKNPMPHHLGGIMWTSARSLSFASDVVRNALSCLLLALIPAVTGGCSFMLVNGPPTGHQELASFTCTESRNLPTSDLGLAGWLVLTRNWHGDTSEPRAPGAKKATKLVVAVLYGLSAYTGFKLVNECRDAKLALARRQRETLERARVMAQPDSTKWEYPWARAPTSFRRQR